MGRSKFPGKPPKTATRKRIKVLGQPEAAQNDPVTVAENIYYGLSLFNETFGDNEKVRGKKVVAPRRPPSPSPSPSPTPTPTPTPTPISSPSPSPSPSSSPSLLSPLPSPSSLVAEVVRNRRASCRATHLVSRREPLACIVRQAT